MKAEGHVVHSRGDMDFPHLKQLLGGYFHQDMAINGDTVEEIVSVFKEDSDRHHWRAVRDDIGRFLSTREDEDEFTKDFFRTFEADLVERPWGMTIRQFWNALISSLLNPALSRKGRHSLGNLRACFILAFDCEY